MYEATDIAYAFVRKGIETGSPITQMKLQKMVYFADGLHLALHGEPLIVEDFQAWKYGPVVPAIYHDYKLYGSAPILDTQLVSFSADDATGFRPDPRASAIINDTWETLKDVSGTQLSNWTHKPDSPWSKHYRPGIQDIIIPKEDIREYFRKFKHA